MQHECDCTALAVESMRADRSADLIVQAQRGVKVLSIAQHLLKRLPAGVVVAGGHKELLYLLKLVYSAHTRISFAGGEFGP